MNFLLILLLAFTAGEQRCFDKVDDPNFVAPVREVRVRVRESRRFRRFSAYVSKARLSRHRLNVFIVPNSSYSACHIGNYGWARRNVCVLKSRDLILQAILAAQDYDVEDHWNYVAETRCVRSYYRRRHPDWRLKSFNAVELVEDGT